MNNTKPNSALIKSVGLPLISEDQQFVCTKRNTKFKPQNISLFTSPQKKLHETANTNLYTMSPEYLKQSVQNDPFMRAKLKCIIKTTQKSLNKENWMKSPTQRANPIFTEPTSLQCGYRLEKQRKEQQKSKIKEFMQIMKENQKKICISSKISAQKENPSHH